MTATHRSAAPSRVQTRSFALDDLRIRSGGDGRTVEAYAAVFNIPVEIHDQDGHYNEQIHRGAFERTLAHRGTNFRVFFNHGMTLHGTPSERGSMPIGTPLEVRTDQRGLLTVTRYNATPLADEVLEGIRSGSICGQSFTGRMLRSDPARGPFRARGGELVTVTRHEIGLIEYGPTPLPAYEDASIVGVRAGAFGTLSDADATLLSAILANLADGDAALDPIVDALTRTDEALDLAQSVIASMLGVPDPDIDDASDIDRGAYLERLRSLATRLEGASARSTSTGTPDLGPASADAPTATGEHSGPKTMRREQVRARLYQKGLL
jgi:HK97 family phage prohead protease